MAGMHLQVASNTFPILSVKTVYAAEGPDVCGARVVKMSSELQSPLCANMFMPPASNIATGASGF